MKKKIDGARTWRNYDRYMILTEEERASLEEHPTGPEADMDDILSDNKTPYVTVCDINDEDMYRN